MALTICVRRLYGATMLSYLRQPHELRLRTASSLAGRVVTGSGATAAKTNLNYRSRKGRSGAKTSFRLWVRRLGENTHICLRFCVLQVEPQLFAELQNQGLLYGKTYNTHPKNGSDDALSRFLWFPGLC
jgi:hypothetical protein